jgi:uncharacterized protein (TIGR02147 family)
MQQVNMKKKQDTIQATSVFSYDDYRKFLADYFKAKKAENPSKYSLRYFSIQAGFKTSSFIPSILAGKKNLTLESIDRIARLIPLKNRPYEYFKTLVLFNQAKTEEEKITYFDQMKEFKEYIQLRLLKKDQNTYMLKWYYPVIREMTRWPDFEPRPNWIAAKIKPSILVAQAKEAMEVLMKLGLVEINDNGSWQPAYPKIGTSDQNVNHEIKSLYDKTILLGRESLKLPASERNISATTLSMSPATFEYLRAKVQKFHKEVTGIISQPITKEMLRETNITEDILNKKGFFEVSEVGQLNIQFFKIAKLRR